VKSAINAEQKPRKLQKCFACKLKVTQKRFIAHAASLTRDLNHPLSHRVETLRPEGCVKAFSTQVKIRGVRMRAPSCQTVQGGLKQQQQQQR